MAYKQAQNRRKKLMKTYSQIKGMRKHLHPGGVWYDEERGFFYKYTASNTPGYTKLLRKQSNKKIRQSTDNLSHGDYRKLYDYKWILF